MSDEKKSSGLGSLVIVLVILLLLAAGATWFIPAACARCEGSGFIATDNKSSGGPVTGPFHHTCSDCEGKGERTLLHSLRFRILGD
jgi:hypothetical protein